MNATLEQLLAIRASRDICCKDLGLNTELVAHLNKVQAAKAIQQATEAIRQAKVYCTTTAYTLQQVH